MSSGDRRTRVMLAIACAIAVSPAAAKRGDHAPSGRTPPVATAVIDRTALQRLRGNTGVSVQWIGWDPARRGTLTVRQPGKLVHLSGVQTAPGRGRLEIEGDVLRIDAHGFSFRGRIALVDAPDAGRRCIRDGDVEFRITQRRRYWRLQQMERCDGLTDYIDIYL